MRVVVIGLGVQGYKRKKFAGSDYVCSVDPINKEADYRSIYDVPLEEYDSVLACIPDEPKYEVIKYCLENGKHVLVEKPLFTESVDQLKELEACAQKKGLVCYTAYNHRFEPHYIRMKELIDSGVLGKIYSCRMFYGNGTARLVRESVWRDSGAGVLPDLGSHLLDTCSFWFGNIKGLFSLSSFNCFENKAPDHAVIELKESGFRISLEMTLCMWRNHFTCDILAENGTAHIESLCKWGPATFTYRKRVFPSGRPIEESETLVMEDPTWQMEYAYFKNLIASKQRTSLSQDIWLQETLKHLAQGIVI